MRCFKHFFSTLIFIFPVLISCESDEPAPIEDFDMLIDRNWRPVGLYNSNGLYELDNDCWDDTHWRFNKNGVFEIDEGDDVCYSYPSMELGEWIHNYGESFVLVTTDERVLYKVTLLTPTNLALRIVGGPRHGEGWDFEYVQ